MIEARCNRHLHFKFDPATMTVWILCKRCSRNKPRDVFHPWPLLEIVERAARGEIVGACAPMEPHFVHWLVKSKAE
jgi:hypothetical protein